MDKVSRLPIAKPVPVSEVYQANSDLFVDLLCFRRGEGGGREDRKGGRKEGRARLEGGRSR